MSKSKITNGWPLSTVEKGFDTLFLALLFILIVGIPLAFTPLTRSVFEVNKLMLLRDITILVYFCWLVRYILFKANQVEEQSIPVIKIGPIKWAKMGLEIPIALWLGVNLLSTIFSQSFIVALIGAYDRWEGIITIINYMLLVVMYAKLITKRVQIHWLMGGIIASTAMSSLYGVFQSQGMDFMNWSVDPTMRVFACINNPVHFCAYVAMVVPIGLGWLLWITSKEQQLINKPIWLDISKWTIFLATVLIYYAQFLSYSRATWMGFIGAMTLFYLLVIKLMDHPKEKTFLLDFLFTNIGIAFFYLMAIFNYQEKSIKIAIIIGLAIMAYIIYAYFISDAYREDVKSRITAYALVIVMYLAFIVDFYALHRMPEILSFILYIILGGGFLFLSTKLTGKTKAFIGRLTIILVFAKLQFIAVSWTSMAQYFILVGGIYLLVLKENRALVPEKKMWLMFFLAIFGIVLIIPTIPTHIADLHILKNNIEADSLKAAANAEQKVDSYKNIAIEGSARTSMWKSAVPWIKDYWLLGTGPDTVKYMYPKYRRPEYGKLEGGHNFTPDRLHNEYLNTFATRGIIGGLIYFIGVIGGWYWVILKGLFRFKDKTPYFYLVLAMMAGVTCYMGQVLFNFGVVATLFLCYTLMGLGLAIVNHPDFTKGYHEEEKISS